MGRPITRRGVLATVAGGCAASAAFAGPAAFPEQPALLVAGPAGSRTDRWAEVIAEPLGRSLQQGSALPRQNVGGPDGVTGANQFQARTAPDGSTALLVPGSAALAWLAGDTRVRFETGTWVPLWGGDLPAALVARTRLAPGRTLRMPVQSLVGPELAGLLALELLGCEVTPVRVDRADATMLERGDFDVALLRGMALQNVAGSAAARGWSVALGFGTLGANGELTRDPAFPDLPIAQEFIGRSRADDARELALALRATTAAMRLDMALVLPQLSPAAVVAWWRRGCTTLATSAEVRLEAARTMVQPVGPGRAAASMGCITADASVLLELRRWLAERHQWRPT